MASKRKAVALVDLIASLDTIGGGSNRPEDVRLRDQIRSRPVHEQDVVAIELGSRATGSLAGLLLTRLAQDDHAACKAARLSGKTIPSAPFLDALKGRNAQMTSTKAEKVANGGGVVGGKRTPKATGVTFTHDGKSVSPTQNKLSSVAWFYTNGLGTGGGRLKVGELKALLKREGVDDPHKPGWSVKLSNGITIGCVNAGAEIPAVEKQPKLATATKPKASTSKRADSKKLLPGERPSEAVMRMMSEGKTASEAAKAKTSAASKAAKAKKQVGSKKPANVTSIDKARELRSSGPNATTKKPAAKKRGQGATKAPTKLAPRNSRTKTSQG
jgi:hypothetical protein